MFAAVVFLAGARGWLWLLAAAVTAPLFLLAVYSRHMDVTYDFGFIRCLYGFSVGALLAWFQHDSLANARRALADDKVRSLWTSIELATILAIILFVSRAGDNDAGIAAPFVFAAALFVFAHEAGSVSTLLRTRGMLLLGALSYSIYMVHIFVQGRMINAAGILDKIIHRDLVGDLTLRGEPAFGFGPHSVLIGLTATVFMLVLVVAASWFTWRFVEMPALAWFRARAKQI
jgi:peptidoglycan/LPS O-acetylase OafA/YrhL